MSEPDYSFWLGIESEDTTDYYKALEDLRNAYNELLDRYYAERCKCD